MTSVRNRKVELEPTVSLLGSGTRANGHKNEKCKKVIKTILPITQWLPRYTCHNLQCDMIAGITVGLMVIPQGIAYATIAGLEPVYGLYCAFMGCFVYCFLGTSKDVSIGPTAIMSLIVDQYCHLSNSPEENIKFAIALSFYAGVIQFAMGFFRIGFIVRFISIPVISAFTSSAAIIIAIGQVKSLLGLKHVRRPFYQCIYDTFKTIGETNPWDVVLGTLCIIILLILRYLGRTKWPDADSKDVPLKQRVARKIIWIAGTGRNALVVLMASLVAYAVVSKGHKHAFSLTSHIHQGLPNFRAPSLTITVGNQTLSTLEVLKQVGPGLAIVPLIGFLESIAIAKAFARKNKYKVDASQELIALGLANCFSSFVSSYPVTGSFSRTAVNAQSGVTTPAGGIFTGAIVLLALGVLTPFFKYIPKASLAALIISSVLTMIEYHIVPKIWKARKIDLLPFFITFFGCFYEIELGILLGIGVSLMIFLYPVVWPKLIKADCDYTVIKVNGDLIYAGMEHVTSEIQEMSYSDPPPRGVVIDLSVVTQIDFTVTQSLLMVLEDLESRKISVFFSGVQNHIRDIMVDSGIELSIINPTPDAMARVVNAEAAPFLPQAEITINDSE
ncbi:sodium-independent sulfate anion transporter-like isoform X1 [Actinia tenebrosa]|uniref:Sodium-independent sulfate anion transporter-like isoform X1 n=1 Tax=Actinia tenebrosa TaxID=6105 RepID=A0A6P8HCH8_ACTTE|nr:sodium-independent sulfate anion transporter-like isoform X1 [Actinia tenebrosa]